MATPELTRWVTVLAAASLVACTPDVDGHGPTRDDVVDWQEVNVFQAR